MGNIRRWLFEALWIVSGSVAVGALAAQVIAYSNNTLTLNRNWVSTKRLMEVKLNGALEFVETRNALHGNRLNINEWFGFNEVTLNQLVTPQALRFRAQIAPGGVLSVFFNRDASGYSGIRLSRLEGFTNLFFNATARGEFSSQQEMESLPINDDWHQIELKFTKNTAEFIFDGRSVGQFAVQMRARQAVGFRTSSEAGTAIDDFEMISRDLNASVHDNFSPHFPQIYMTACCALLYLLGLLILAFVRQWPGLRELTLQSSVIGLVLLAGMSAYYALDFYYWSPRYWVNGVGALRPAELGIRAEKTRGEFFARVLAALVEPNRKPGMTYMSPAIGKVLHAFAAKPLRKFGEPMVWTGSSAETYQMPQGEEFATRFTKHSGDFRVVWVGTSQTYGAGAPGAATTMVGLSHENLRRDYARLQSFNFAIPGSDSTQLLDLYRQRWIGLQPDLTILNLGNNDTDVRTLFNNLEAFIQLNREHAIATILLLEGNAPLATGRAIVERLSWIQQVGKKLGVPVLDFYGYMASAQTRNRGFLWWDSVHLTAAGQALAAEWMATQLRQTQFGRKPILPTSELAAGVGGENR